MAVIPKAPLRIITAIAGVIILVILLGFAKNLGLLSVLGVQSTSRDSQVIQAIERTQEVSLLSLGIQGIKDERKCSTVFGGCVPGSGETVYLQYTFTAKLGLDGSKVDLKKTGEHSYLVNLPEFIGIGFSDPTFEIAVTDGGALSWITPDIDQVEMVNEILNDKSKKEYIDSNRDILEDQAKFFYDSLILGIDPDATTTYEFAS